MKSYHDALVIEMLARGYNHKSEYIQPDISYLPFGQQHTRVDIEYNIKDLCDLCDRCEECRSRIQ